MQYRYAWSLSKDEVAEATPLGTSRMVEQDEHTMHKGEIKLVPQPSEDPADPLNWGRWRKIGVLLMSSFWVFVANYQAACVSSAYPFMVMAFPKDGPISSSKFTHLVSVNVLLTGTSNIWWTPIANSFGRRPVVLFSIALTTGASIWAAKATSYNSLLVARMFQGIGSGTSETVALDAINSVFFVHQRGRAAAFFITSLALGAAISPIDGSYLANGPGWRWILWICTIMAGVAFLLSLFLFPETLYDRNVLPPSSETSNDAASTAIDNDPKNVKPETSKIESVASGETYEPYTFLRSLKMGTNRSNFAKELLKPYAVLVLPGVWAVTVAYSTLVASTISMNLIGSQLVAVPPYLWGLNSGLINVGALVGSLIGFVFTYVSADWFLKRVAKRGQFGLGEPESRLPILIGWLWLSACGNWIFGACAAHPGGLRWLGLQVGAALQGAATGSGSVGFNYVMESYPALSGDCLTIIVAIRGLVAFAWTFFSASWIEKDGAMIPFGIYGMLVGLSGIVIHALYIWGKRCRIATADFVEKL